MSHTISVSLVVRRDMNSCPPRQLLITFLLRPLQRREDSYKRVCIRKTGIRPCTEEDSSVMVRICWTPTSPSQADIMIRKQLLRKELKKNISRRKVRGKNDDFSVRWERIQPGFGKSAATFRAHRIFTFLSSASVHSVAYFTTQCWKVQYITQCNMYSTLHNATHRIFTFFSNASVHSVAYFTTQCHKPKYSIQYTVQHA